MKDSHDEHRTRQSGTLPPFGGAAALRAMKARKQRVSKSVEQFQDKQS